MPVSLVIVEDDLRSSSTLSPGRSIGDQALTLMGMMDEEKKTVSCWGLEDFGTV